MSKITIFEKKTSSMDADVARSAGKLQVLTPPQGMNFKVEVDIDSKVEKQAAADPLLHQQMVDAIKEVYDALVNRIGDHVAKLERGAVKLRDDNELEALKKLVDRVDAGFTGARDAAVTDAEKALEKVWKDLAKKRQEYGKYKIKVAAKCAVATCGLVASIALFSTGVVTFGASAIPGVIGMAKSVTACMGEMVSAYQAIETAQERLGAKLKLIEDRFVDARGQFTKAGKAQETGMMLAAQFFGTSGPLAVLPSIKDAVGELNVVKSKADGIETQSHDAAKDLAKILGTIDGARKVFLAEVRKALAKNPSPLARDQDKAIEKRLDLVLAPFVSQAEDAIEQVQAMQARLKKAAARIKVANDHLKSLIALKGLGWKVFDNTLAVIDLPLSFVDPSSYEKARELIAGVGLAAGTLTADKVTKKALEGSFLE